MAELRKILITELPGEPSSAKREGAWSVARALTEQDIPDHRNGKISLAAQA